MDKNVPLPNCKEIIKSDIAKNANTIKKLLNVHNGQNEPKKVHNLCENKKQ